MNSSTYLSAVSASDPDRAAQALAAVEGISTADLAKLPRGALAAARVVCVALAHAPALSGFNEDSEVSGSAVVELLSAQWRTVRHAGSSVLPTHGDATGPTDDLHAMVSPMAECDEAIALLQEYAAEFTEEPEFADSLQGRVDAFLVRVGAAGAGDAVATGDAPSVDPERERLEDERWRLLNSFGHGDFADGRTRERIAEIDARLSSIRGDVANAPDLAGCGDVSHA